jgi:ATP-binding cassette subfamily B protein
VGKTTLINILMGFIAPSSGEIKINGKKRDASTINLVRRKCGLIGQETYIVGRTVREAFEYKVSDVQENLPEIRRLSKMLSLCNSKNFESWFESTIEDGGVNLSVGQRQRIAIILEFVGDNELIFMDEFTSALDFESAERTCEIVASSKKTVCAITHSSAVASHFEKVLVIGE